MSGIAGIIRFDGGPIDPDLIVKMTSSMRHRGPDGTKHWISRSVTLGHCMLHTTAESLGEEQPLTNEDSSLVLVMDGWLANWEELRKQLLDRGEKLSNSSDAGLILRSYEVWGPDCVTRLDGEFSFAIWNSKTRQAFCVRDRTSKKPFNYYWDGTTFIFASEVPAIFQVPTIRRELDETQIAEILAFRWAARDRTPWQAIKRLVAANSLTIDASGIRFDRYWQPRLDATIRYRCDREYFEHYREIFADCVRRASRSYRPIACEVSGGHDSSAVFCMADHLKKKGVLPAPALVGYTMAFLDDPAANEVFYARAVARHLDTTIHEVQPSKLPLTWFQNSATEFLEFPGYPNATSALALKQQVAASGSRVLLNGEGGDEWCGGRRTYYADELSQGDWRGLSQSLRADFEAVGAVQTAIWLARHGFFNLLPSDSRAFLHDMRRKSFNSSAKVYDWLTPRATELLKGRTQDNDPIIRTPSLHSRYRFLANGFTAYCFEMTERLSASCGIEARSPMYNHKFIDFMFATPERLRRRGNINKFIHLRALEGILTREVAERTDNAGFAGPFQSHLNQMGAYFREAIPVELRDWIEPRGLVRLYSEYAENGNKPHIWELWSAFGISCVVKARNG